MSRMTVNVSQVVIVLIRTYLWLITYGVKSNQVMQPDHGKKKQQLQLDRSVITEGPRVPPEPELRVILKIVICSYVGAYGVQYVMIWDFGKDSLPTPSCDISVYSEALVC
jgi:hypothetical protein